MIISGPPETPSYNPWGGYRLQAVDNMISAWGGTSPGVPYPEIVVTDGDPQGIACNFKATQQNLAPTPVTAGQSLTAAVTVNFSGTLQYNWYIVDDTATGHYSPQNYEGTASSAPNGASQNTTTGSGNSQTNTVTFNAPQNSGQYQLRGDHNQRPRSRRHDTGHRSNSGSLFSGTVTPFILSSKIDIILKKHRVVSILCASEGNPDRARRSLPHRCPTTVM